MKTLFLSVAFVCASFAMFAQGNMVVSAYNYLKSGKLDKALESIEPTISNPKTMNEAKTWLYRGNVYLGIAMTDNVKYKNLSPNPLDIAYESYMKSISFDRNFVASSKPATAIDGLYFVGAKYYDLGAAKYNSREWKDAKDYFEKTKNINASIGLKDSLATFYATQCALQLNENEVAIKYLKELINMDYRNSAIYTMLVDLYKKSGDTLKIDGTIKIARQRFPNDLNILIMEVNKFLASGDLAKAQDLLKQAVEKDPSNPVLYFVIGSNYDKLAVDPTLSSESRENMLKEAENSYLKAISLKPNYFDAYFNLGVLFYNAGADIKKEADNIPPDQIDAYAAAEAKFKSYWEKALPSLEKAHEIDANDFNTMVALKNIYSRLSMPDKLKIINDKINSLPNKK